MPFSIALRRFAFTDRRSWPRMQANKRPAMKRCRGDANAKPISKPSGKAPRRQKTASAAAGRAKSASSKLNSARAGGGSKTSSESAEPAPRRSPSVPSLQVPAEMLAGWVDGEADLGDLWWSLCGVEEEKLSGWFPFVDEDFLCSDARAGEGSAGLLWEEPDHDIWQLQHIHEIPQTASKDIKKTLNGGSIVNTKTLRTQTKSHSWSEIWQTKESFQLAANCGNRNVDSVFDSLYQLLHGEIGGYKRWPIHSVRGYRRVAGTGNWLSFQRQWSLWSCSTSKPPPVTVVLLVSSDFWFFGTLVKIGPMLQEMWLLQTFNTLSFCFSLELPPANHSVSSSSINSMIERIIFLVNRQEVVAVFARRTAKPKRLVLAGGLKLVRFAILQAGNRFAWSVKNWRINKESDLSLKWT
ncbi:hypothetical protein ZIOFF_061423 [Zingiber officinale]|uniref:Uncharacterized protein n=2 Tax=Zingiber officinale TaxID=94328 RepID=A0A8J5F1X9_ZINOF|nr:hypothetical protein ZIOFF_061423 [Zingiber officinale]